MENGIALDVNPIVRFCRNVAAQAILFVVGRNLLIRRIRLEQGPTPAIAPQYPSEQGQSCQEPRKDEGVTGWLPPRQTA